MLNIIMVAMVLLFTGCFYTTIKTSDVNLNLQDQEKLSLGLSQRDIKALFDVNQVPNAYYRNRLEDTLVNDLYSTLIEESKGRVTHYHNQPLTISASYIFRPEYDSGAYFSLVLLSLIVPPLALIEQSAESHYTVHYTVYDGQEIIYKRSLEGIGEGSFYGWFMGRVEAHNNLINDEARVTARNAARLILKDLDENTENILASIKSLQAPSMISSSPQSQQIIPVIPSASSEMVSSVSQKSSSEIISSDVDEPPVQKVKKKSNAYAIVIGIEKYRQKLPNADYAVHDAKTVKEYLLKSMGYPKENVILLLNEMALRSDMKKYFEKWLVNNVEKDSIVFIYYSGHGSPNAITGYASLVPYDADLAFIDQTGYPLQRMYDYLSRLPAKEIIVALDSCFSGAGGRSVVAKGSRPLVVNLSENLVLAPNIVILSASMGNQISTTYEEKGHGLFTYFLLKGIKTGDMIGDDNSLKIHDLFNYVKPEVERVAKKQYNNSQTPQLIESSK